MPCVVDFLKIPAEVLGVGTLFYNTVEMFSLLGEFSNCFVQTSVVAVDPRGEFPQIAGSGLQQVRLSGEEFAW